MTRRTWYSLLILTCAVLILLATLSLDKDRSNAYSSGRPAEQVLTENHLAGLRVLCYRFRDKVGTFPRSQNDLWAMFPSLPATQFSDGWGRNFRFYTNGHGGLMIVSLGADGTNGGLGTNADYVLQLK